MRLAPHLGRVLGLLLLLVVGCSVHSVRAHHPGADATSAALPSDAASDSSHEPIVPPTSVNSSTAAEDAPTIVASAPSSSSAPATSTPSVSHAAASSAGDLATNSTTPPPPSQSPPAANSTDQVNITSATPCCLSGDSSSTAFTQVWIDGHGRSHTLTEETPGIVRKIFGSHSDLSNQSMASMPSDFAGGGSHAGMPDHFAAPGHGDGDGDGHCGDDHGHGHHPGHGHGHDDGHLSDCIDLPMAEYSQLDGRCNNLIGHPEYGMVSASYLRLLAPRFPGDGSGQETYRSPVLPRRLSNILFDQSTVGDMFDERNLSNWVVDFGQFINHDTHLNAGGGGIFHPIESRPLDLPEDELIFNASIPFERAEYSPMTGDGRYANSRYRGFNPRLACNTACTGWLDLSPIYGVGGNWSQQLRGSDGLLKSQHLAGGEFPWFVHDLPQSGILNPTRKTTLLSYGDFRANEQLGLSVIQLIWFREHNRLAREIRQANASLSADEVFFQARRMNIALLQKCTIDYYLSLGIRVPEYRGYIPRDPSAYAEFVGAALRMGHSQIYDELEQFDTNHQKVGGVPLENGFFSPETLYLESGQVEAFVRGFSYGRAQAVDAYAVDAVRLLLFGPGLGMDLLAIDVERTYDLGLPTFARTRHALGLRPITKLDELTDDTRAKARIRLAFNISGGDLAGEARVLSQCDLFTCGIIERHARGCSMGDTFRVLFQMSLDQLRDTDRFWFERPGALDARDAKEDDRLREVVLSTNFGDIAARNTNITRDQLQENIFFAFNTPEFPLGAANSNAPQPTVSQVPTPAAAAVAAVAAANSTVTTGVSPAAATP